MKVQLWVRIDTPKSRSGKCSFWPETFSDFAGYVRQRKACERHDVIPRQVYLCNQKYFGVSIWDIFQAIPSGGKKLQPCVQDGTQTVSVDLFVKRLFASETTQITSA